MNNEKKNIFRSISDGISNSTIICPAGEACLSCRDQNQWEALPSGPFDNATGRAIRSQLPLKMKMADLYGRELCYRFRAPLPTDNVAYTRYEVGEIVYWPPRHSFVIMYAQNGEMFDMQKIGKILSPLPVHWSGDVEVEITAEK